MSFKRLFIPILLIFIPLFFFYKTILFNQVPFPGDLLMGNYDPYKSNTVEDFPDAVPHKGQGADVIRELYPWKKFSIDTIKAGSFPLWNPYVFSGNTHFANLQSGVFYPVNIVFFIMPFMDGWTVYILLQYMFLLIFTYLYLRELNLAKSASILGSVAFSFSGFIIVWGEYGNLGHAICFLPLSLYCVEKILREGKAKWYFLLTLAVTLSIFAGYIQLSMYMLLILGAYVLSYFFIQKEKKYKKYILILASMSVGLLLSAIQIIPLYEVLSLSLRSTYGYAFLLDRLLPPESIITLLVPDFFGNPATANYFLRGGSSLERAMSIGVWPLLFAVIAIFTKRSFIKNFFLISTAVIFLSTVAIPPVAYFHSIGIPFLSTGIPTRALSIFCFCLAVLSAIGMDAYLKNIVEKRKIIITLIVFLILFLVLFSVTILVQDPNLLVSRRNLILPAGVFLLGSMFLIFIKQKKAVVVVLITLTILELFYSFQKFNSFVPKSYVYPETHISKKLRRIQGIDRYWGYGGANIDTNFQIIEKNYGTDGYDPLFSKHYGELMSGSKNGEILSDMPRTVANILPGYGVNELKQNPFRQRALNLTGVKFILNRKDSVGLDSAFPKDLYTLSSEKYGWQIYNNKNVLGRVVLFGNYMVQPNSKKAVSTLYSPSFNFHNTVILEEEPGDTYKIMKDPASKVKVTSYGQNKIIFKTESSQDQLLFISDNYFPGWVAKVDGVDTKILRANHAFRAIPLKKGNHTVIMSYFPNSFVVGSAISAVSVLGLFAAAAFVVIMRKGHKKSKKKS